MAKNIIYCVYCGTENDIKIKKCVKCKKQLDPKNRPFRDYLVEKVKDKVTGDVQENIFSLITNYIKSHLYGFILTCSVVFAVGAGIIGGVNKPDSYEILNNNPSLFNEIDYLGDGLSPEEIIIKYADAMNNGDIKSVKAYELSTFYPDLYKSLIDKKSTDYEFLDKNKLNEESNILFKNDYSYGLSIYYGAQPKGKYDKYEFIRYLLEISYEFPESTDNKDDLYAFSYSVEFIKVDGNYYISGTEMDKFFTDVQESIYDLFVENEGDTTKFTLDDVYNHMEREDG